jgi:thymidylate kinase
LEDTNTRRHETIKLISFEGADFVGKTTTAKYVADLLRPQYPEAIYNLGNIYQSPELARLESLAVNSDNLDRERIYTKMFSLDRDHDIAADPRVLLQDRYWMSVVAYGRFLNGEKSIHHISDLSSSFVQPDMVIHLKCSYEEKIRRSMLRSKPSKLDKLFLNDPALMRQLEQEIENSLRGLPVITIDTTEIVLPDVANYVMQELDEGGVLCRQWMTSSSKTGIDHTPVLYK